MPTVLNEPALEISTFHFLSVRLYISLLTSMRCAHGGSQCILREPTA